jgi:branched-chain amino acid transport system substrate-binding protein
MIVGNRVAADEIMKAGGFLGRPVEFIVRDDAGNPELTSRYCREFATKEEVDWIFVGLSTGSAFAASAVAKEFKVPTFIFGGRTDSITIEHWNPYIFRYQGTCSAEARIMVRLLKDEVLKGVKNPKIFWLTWDYEYGKDLYKVFAPTLKEMMPDAKMVGEGWPRTGETDYGPFMNHILALSPNVVVNSIWAGGVVSMLKQGTAMGVWKRSTILSTADVAQVEYRRIAGQDMPVGTWANAYDDAVYPNNERQRRFYQACSQLSGKPELPSGYAASTYYITHLVNAAMTKAKSTEALAMIKAMEGISIDTFWGVPLSVRDFDHQVFSAQVWGPMIAKEGQSYLDLDPKRSKYIPYAPDLITKEAWLARRKAAEKK